MHTNKLYCSGSVVSYACGICSETVHVKLMDIICFQESQTDMPGLYK
uniref:Uncharacterized protein n=1 Tax=Arundo donax TaxID=35708 RepID=A0A0A9F7M6_ARUDO